MNYLLELLLVLLACCGDCKLCAEYVAQLGTVAIATTCTTDKAIQHRVESQSRVLVIQTISILSLLNKVRSTVWGVSG